MTTSAAQRPIDAVIFDLGGVFTASPFVAIARMAETVGLGAEEAVELLFGPYERDTDHPWHRAERGELDLRSCRREIRELSRAAGTELDLYDVMTHMAEIEPGVRTGVVERVRTLRAAGLRSALLTNNISELRDFWRPLLPLEELFDDVVDSSEVGLRKPDERIFRLALERLGGIPPERAAFLDDHPGNVEAARRLGIVGFVVGDPWVEALDALDAHLRC